MVITRSIYLHISVDLKELTVVVGAVVAGVVSTTDTVVLPSPPLSLSLCVCVCVYVR